QAGRTILQLARNLVDARASGGTAIAEKTAAMGIEEGHAGNPPVARRRAVAGDADTRVAKRRLLLERAGSLAVHAILAGSRDRGDALADQGLARRPLDPAHDSVGAGLPAEAFCRLRIDGGASGLAILLLVAAISLDSLDQLLDLGFRLRRRRGRPGERAFEDKVAGAKHEKRLLHLGRQVTAMAKQGACRR